MKVFLAISVLWVTIAGLISLCSSWDGIIIDSIATSGGTQMIYPNGVPKTVGGLNYGLPHAEGACAVSLGGSVYFLGGSDAADTAPGYKKVTKFNPATNTSTAATPLLFERLYAACTILGNTIVICGGD
jgi:hypothetical protein